MYTPETSTHHTARLARFFFLFTLAAAAGCGNASTVAPELENEDGPCAAPLTMCGDACVDLENDNDNCGECGSICAHQGCIGGECAGVESEPDPEPEPEPEPVGDCVGQLDGTPCGDPTATECNDADTCLDEVCVPKFTPIATLCGNKQATECDWSDRCDGVGHCVEIFAHEGTACGDPTWGLCDLPDKCDGQGTCQENAKTTGPLCQCVGQPDGTPCGEPSEGECDAPDTCLNEVCEKNFTNRYTLCGDPTETPCDRADWCDGVGTCRDGRVAAGVSCGGSICAPHLCDEAGACVVVAPAPPGTTCGAWWEEVTECDFADTCDGAGTCQENFSTVGSACGDPTESECDTPDSCDGAGRCQRNPASYGVPCGDGPEGACILQDTCSGRGTCEQHFAPAYAECSDADDGSAQQCNGSGVCGELCEITLASGSEYLPVDSYEWIHDTFHGGSRQIYTQVYALSDLGIDTLNPTRGGLGVSLSHTFGPFYADGHQPGVGLYLWNPAPGEAPPPLEELTRIGGAGVWPDDEVYEPQNLEFELEPFLIDASSRLVVATSIDCTAHHCVYLDSLPEITGIATGEACNPSECAGQPDGTPCGDPSASTCDGADTCLNQVCVNNHEPLETQCGGTTCEPMRCDAFGDCIARYSLEGTACGDSAVEGCDLADTCDGVGSCLSNIIECGGDGTDSCVASTCDFQGMCRESTEDCGSCYFSLSQSTDSHLITGGGSGSCVRYTNGGYMRAYDLSDLGVDTLEVDNVRFGIELAEDLFDGEQYVQVDLYAWDPTVSSTPNRAQMDRLGGAFTTVANTRKTFLNVPITASFTDPSMRLVVEVIPNAESEEFAEFIMGSNTSGQSALSYCGARKSTDPSTPGNPDAHIILDVEGMATGPVCNP